MLMLSVQVPENILEYREPTSKTLKPTFLL